MAKGCGNCGKPFQTGHQTLLECITGGSKGLVEFTYRDEALEREGTVLPSDSTVHVTTSTVHLPRNRKWEQSHSDEYRAWRKEYDRKRRSRGKLTG